MFTTRLLRRATIAGSTCSVPATRKADPHEKLRVSHAAEATHG